MRGWIDRRTRRRRRRRRGEEAAGGFDSFLGSGDGNERNSLTRT